MNDLRRAIIAKRWVTSVQLDPFQSANSKRLKKLLQELSKIGVSVVDVNSSRKGIKQDSVAMASGIQREVKNMIAIPHVTSRDSLVDAVLSQILGAYTWAGVKNILVVRGDPKEMDDAHNTIPGVYQLDSPELIRLLDYMRRDRKMDLFIGCAFCQTHQTEETKMTEWERLQKKIAFGADFIMTQPVFYRSGWEEEIENMRRLFSRPFMVGLWPIFDEGTFMALKSGKVTGVVLPAETREMLEKNWKNRIAMQSEWILEMFEKMRGMGVAGVYIVAPFRKKHYAGFLKFLKMLKQVL